MKSLARTHARPLINSLLWVRRWFYGSGTSFSCSSTVASSWTCTYKLLECSMLLPYLRSSLFLKPLRLYGASGFIPQPLLFLVGLSKCFNTLQMYQTFIHNSYSFPSQIYSISNIQIFPQIRASLSIQTESFQSTFFNFIGSRFNVFPILVLWPLWI